MTDIHLIPGVTYILHTRIGQQKLVREHCMTFLGRDYEDYLFNARPGNGTQMLSSHDIIDYWPSDGKTQHYMNKVMHDVR